MHRYRMVAQISLVFSILNLVLAAPIVLHEIHKARHNEIVVAEDMTTGRLEAAPDRLTSPRSSPNARAPMQDPPLPDTMESPQDTPSPHESASSGYSYDTPESPAPDLPGSDQPYAWLMERPQRLSLYPPAKLHDSASPHPSSSGPTETPPPPAEGQEPLPPPLPPVGHPPVDQPLVDSFPLPHLPIPLPSLPHPSSSGTSGPSEIQLSPHLIEPNRAPTATESTSGGLAPLSQPQEMPEGSMPSLESISGGSGVPLRHSMPEGLAPLQHLTTDWSPSSTLPPTPTPPDNAEFFDENLMKRIGIITGIIILGGTAATGLGLAIKHHQLRDCQDS